MEKTEQLITQKRKIVYVMLVMGVILAAFNLRPGITSVGPLVNDIQTDLHLAHWSAGLLTSLPLIAFAVMSPIVPAIANRLSNGWTLITGLILIIVGLFVRTTPILFLLFIGTFLVGVGIAILNVILPVIVKDKFPHKFALMTSVYTTSMSGIAALASGLSVPLANGLNLGWRNSLLVWAIPAVIAIVVWVILLRLDQNERPQKIQLDKQEKTTNLWNSSLAWQIALFMGLQSFLFYVTITWLPDILHSKGLSFETAGWLLSITQIIGLPANFFVPIIAEKFDSQKKVALGICSTSIIGFTILLFSTSYLFIIISIVFFGLGLGGTFSLALAFIGMRAKDAKQSAQLSGMAQSIGYIFAAVGPILIGSLFDMTNMWTVPIVTIIIVGILTAFFGSRAGENRYV